MPVCAFTYKREHKPPKAERCIPASNIVSAILIIEKRDTGEITGLDRLTTTEHFISRKKNLDFVPLGLSASESECVTEGLSTTLEQSLP